MEQIVKQIRTGRLQPGDKLPGEKALAEEFQVSRPSVREALRMLETVGVVEVRRGKGCYVLQSPDGTDMSSVWLSWLSMFKTEVLALLEVREAIEGQVAALAARRASPEHLAELAKIVEEGTRFMEEGLLTPEAAHRLDVRFHEVMGRACGNPFLIQLQAGVDGAIVANRRAVMEIPRRMVQSIEEHKGIFQAVKSGDGEKAREVMVAHVQLTAKDVEAGAKSNVS